MGIYDREYYREEQPPGLRLGGNLSMAVKLVIVTVAIYLVDRMFLDGGLSKIFGLHSRMTSNPIWPREGLFNIWQLLTCGFLHAPRPWHVIMNMFVLWMFGREIEGVYGSREFLKTYLSLIILSSAVWLITELVIAEPGHFSRAVGASGGVTGILFIYILRNPRRTLLLWGVLPIPAWLVGVFCIGTDLMAANNPDTNIAYMAHLGGAAFGYLYFKTGWSLFRLVPQSFSLAKLGPKTRLRLHDPEAKEGELSGEADRILAKISRSGQESLTRRERRILEDYSRRMQRKRQ